LGKFGAPGDWLVLISAVNWAVFSVWSRSGLKKQAAAFMRFYVMLAGWIILSVLCFARADLVQLGKLSTSGLLALGFLGIFCSGFAYIFWYDALKHIPASQTGVFLYLEPLVTVVAASRILGEFMTTTTWIGGAAILAGVWIVNLPANRKATVNP
jgi:drug/metabolite transporter (DMT)-like permease